jgi:long-subunit acyl-CoA synthetase (AMP-forming)
MTVAPPADPTTVAPTADPVARRGAIDVALAQATLPAAFQATVRASGDEPALRVHGGEDVVTWADYGRRVRAIAGGLDGIGVGPGDAVAIVAGNLPAFNVFDTAALHVGATPYSLYPTEPLEQMIALVEDAGARVVAAEARHLERARAIAAGAAGVRHVVLLDAEDSPDDGPELGLGALVARAAPGFDFDAAWRAIPTEAIATLVYTSGTTGRPKGVELSHRAIMAALRGIDAMAPATPRGRGVSFLPSAHIVDRFVCHYTTIGYGGTLTTVPDPDGLWDAIHETRPTRFFGVPRTWEKLADRARVTAAGDAALQAALALGHDRLDAQAAGAPAPEGAEEAREALAPVRAALGLQDAEWLAVASAPSALETLRFHHALGLDLRELWGMTEFMMALMNPAGATRLGTVGVPLPGVEVRIAPDGELLLRGPHACSGYRGLPEATAELWDADGWLHSGDLAAVDPDGYHRIVGRKKELMINSSGKNLVPAKIEGAIADASPLIGYVAAIGDRRRYVSALVVLDAPELRAFAAARGLSGSYAELTAREEVRAEVARAVEAGNARLSRVEHVRAHTVLPDEWTPGDALVTNTMKLRRAVIAERYADVIERLYAG